jgi:hypothetical protein
MGPGISFETAYEHADVASVIQGSADAIDLEAFVDGICKAR